MLRCARGNTGFEKGALMKSTCRFIVLCGAFLLLGTSLEAQAPSSLETTGDFPGGGHLWISAKVVADEEKIVDLDLIGSDALRKSVEKQRQALGDRLPAEKSTTGEKPLIATIPASECKSTTMSVDDRGGLGGSATLADLATYSQSIVRGKIRTVDLGFNFGTPTSLLEVEVSEVLKGSAPKSPFYVDYPVARFRIGPFSFCNLNRGFEPHPGDEILLFAYQGPVDRDDVLYAPRLDQILFQSQSGTLFLPPPLKDTPELKAARTLNEVVGRLRSGRLLQSREGGR
jgi:hypothetical protein